MYETRLLPGRGCANQSNRDLVQIDIVASGHRDIEWPGKLSANRASKGHEADRPCCLPIRRDGGNTDRRHERWIVGWRRDRVVRSPTVTGRHGCNHDETTGNLLKTTALCKPSHRIQLAQCAHP